MPDHLRRLACFLISALLLGASTTPVRAAKRVAPDEVFRNGGFEHGRRPWWGKTGEISTLQAFDGSQSLKLSGGFVAQDKRPVIGGQRYRFSVAIRSDGAPASSVYVQMSFRGEGVAPGWYGPETVGIAKKRRERALLVTGGAHGWQQLSTVVAAPPGAREVLIYLRKKPGTAGEAFFDAVTLTPTEDPEDTIASRRRRDLAATLLAPGGSEAAVRTTAAAARVDGAGDEVVLARTGQPRFRIRIADDADVVELNAAGELAKYLGRISGADFLPLSTTVGTTDGPLIVVGHDAALLQRFAPGIDTGALGPDGFIVKAAPGRIVIAAQTSRGVMYGVNWFLDHKLGVKWLSPDYTFVPSRSTLTLTPFTAPQRPRFAYREVLSREAQDKWFRAHNLLNGESHGPSFVPSPPEIDVWDRSWMAQGGSANFWQLLERKKNVAQHPEWFLGGQVAMMDPTVREKVADGVISRLRQHPDYRHIWFDVHDMDWGWDLDAQSQAFANRFGGTAAAPRADMMIDVASRVRQVLPDAKLAFNAYHWSITPPSGMRIPDHILVFPMTINVDYASPLFAGNNLQLGRDIEGWTAIANNVMVWDHIANFSGFLQPTPNIYPIGKSIRWLAGLDKIHGYFAEGSWNTSGAEFASLRAWVIARLLWDPTLDVRSVVSEFCRYYYGAAAAPLMAYIDLMHEAIARTGDVLGEKAQADLAMYDLDFVMAADALFARAELLVSDDPDRLKHVRAARMPVDYVALVRRFDLVREAQAKGVDWPDDTDGRVQRLLSTATREGVRQYRQGGSMEELRTLLAVTRRVPERPPVAEGRGAADWRDYQDLSFNRYGATRIVEDVHASDGAAAIIPREKGGWLIQFKFDRLPRDGQWDLYVALRPATELRAKGGAFARTGSYPPMNRSVVVTREATVANGYQYVKVPGGPFRRVVDHARGVYVQAAEAGLEAQVMVDRIVAVRRAPQ